MSNIPKVRFSGFSKSWVERKLGDIAEIIGGGTPSTSNPEYWDGDIDWYAPAEMEGKRYATGSARKITELGLQKSSAKILPAERTVLFTSRAGIGKMAILKHPGSTNQGFQSLVMSDSYNPYFIYSMEEEIKAKAEGVASGSTFLEISGKMLGNIKIFVPSKQEQDAVSECFERVDNLITLQQREYEKLVALKAACLDKMFPKNGSKVPEMRFAGFCGDWESYKLGSIGKTYTGLSGKTKEDFGHGEGRFVTYMNVYLNPVSDISRTDLVEIDTSQNAVQYGDVFFTTSSETPEEVGMSSVWLGKFDNVYLNSFCFGFRPTIEIDPLYMAYMLRSGAVRKKITYLAQGISRYNISKNRVMEIEVPLPDMDEQKLIGQYFNSLDKLITLHQCKMENFRKVKKAMLHNMFV